MSLTDAVEQCDLPALMRNLCGEAAVRHLGKRGGTICDPRPGMAEVSASFSVWQTSKGVWMWKKRGKNAGGGTAFNFLVSLGRSGSQARAELLEFTGQSSTWSPSTSRPADPPPSVLDTAKKRLAELRPALNRQVSAALQSSRPLSLQDAAGQELQRRGLWPPGHLEAVMQAGHLILILRHPTGRIMNLKRKTLHGQGSKYCLLFPGIGTPPWVNPGYGQAEKVLLVEGELNAAAAWRVITEHGLNFDVQGVAGADTWPYLDGLDREVWIYADPDPSGDGMRARLQELAFQCGSARVHQVPPVTGGLDFCDLLGQQGSLALLAHLLVPPDRKAEPSAQSAPRPSLSFQQTPLIGEGNALPQWPLVARARAR